ncbi:MAG: response regulator transcription factor [Deltaproteobacteria bacterium]|nr:response regulator transcription factor [Deltaproteobacteria bacterium]MBI3062788.1 response regulator transcription factor [Deltaproteobacteria bacterium]
MKVFIAYGLEIVRERLKVMLGELKDVQIIGETEDYAEAAESILRLKPDGVILDVHLSGGGGIEVLEEIKKNEPSPVVIMLANHPSFEYRKICQELGANYFFDRSTELDKIVDLLRRLARTRA